MAKTGKYRPKTAKNDKGAAKEATKSSKKKQSTRGALLSVYHILIFIITFNQMNFGSF